MGGSLYIDIVRVTTEQPLPPIIGTVVPNPDPILNGIPYSRQLTLTQGDPAPTWSVLQGPVGLTVSGAGPEVGFAEAIAVGGRFDWM